MLISRFALGATHGERAEPRHHVMEESAMSMKLCSAITAVGFCLSAALAAAAPDGNGAPGRTPTAPAISGGERAPGNAGNQNPAPAIDGNREGSANHGDDVRNSVRDERAGVRDAVRDPAERRDDRMNLQNDRRDRIEDRVQERRANGDDWRFVLHNNQWWYWQPNNRWVIWRGGSWVDYDPVTYSGANPVPYRAGYRGDVNVNSDGENWYYDDGQYYYYRRAHNRSNDNMRRDDNAPRGNEVYRGGNDTYNRGNENFNRGNENRGADNRGTDNRGGDNVQRGTPAPSPSPGSAPGDHNGDGHQTERK